MDYEKQNSRLLRSKQDTEMMWRKQVVFCRLAVGWLVCLATMTISATGSDSTDTPAELREAIDNLNRLLARENLAIASRVNLIVRVLEEQLTVLPGAEVKIKHPVLESRESRGFANIDGKVLFRELPPGLYEIEAHFPGFEPSTGWVLLVGIQPNEPATRRTLILRERLYRIVPADRTEPE